MQEEKDNRAIEEKIRFLANQYALNLKKKIGERIQEMKGDDSSHYLIYRVLGISNEEGELIDIYHLNFVQ